MRSLKAVWFPLLVLFCFVSGVEGQEAAPPASEADSTTPARLTQLPAATSLATPASFAQVIDRIGEYAKAGAAWVILAMRAPFDWEGLALFVRDVMPAFR